MDGIGEETCASLRCKYHIPIPVSPRNNRSMWEDASTPGPSVSERGRFSRYHDRDPDSTRQEAKKKRKKRTPDLRAFELPFVYEEAGERKEALVKVRLCAKCQAKLVWKPGKEEPDSEDAEEDRGGGKRRREENKEDGRSPSQSENNTKTQHGDDETQRRRRRESPSDSDNDRPSGSVRRAAQSRPRSLSRSQSPARRRDDIDDRPRRRNVV